MKLTKKEALEVYYLLRYGNDGNEEVEDLLHKLQEHLTSESSESVLDEDEEGGDESSDEDEDEDEDGSTDYPDFDDVIDASDLTELSQCPSTIEGRSQRVKFQSNDDGCDLVAGKQEKIDNVQYVQRSANVLSVWSDGWWHDFDVKRFPKEWTVLLEVDRVYKLD